MNKPFIVAEMSSSHLGSLARAILIVDAAAEAGADAVKLQTFTPDQMVGDPNYIIPDGPWHGRRLLSLYEEAHLPREWHETLFDRCKRRGIECFSTPFHPDDVEFLETLGCPRYKIASFEITDLTLIAACAKTGKPLVISTGMATKEEIRDAAITASHNGCHLTVLKCTSAYPADAQAANLKTMCDMMRFCDVGLSDHTPGIGVAVGAAALGASIIEKHFTLSRADGGPDADFSMEPHEFSQMVTECRRAAAAIGEVKYGPSESEQSSVSLRRSLWFCADLKDGDVVAPEHIKCARPALGLNPDLLSFVVGRRVTRDVMAGQPIRRDDIKGLN